MRPFGIIVALAGIALVGSVLAAYRTMPPAPGESIPESAPQIVEPDVADAPLLPARPVEPDLFAAPSVPPQALERTGPREPLGPLGRAYAPSEGPPRETILHRPLVTEAGAFSALGYSVKLAGIVPTDAGEECGSGDAAWPCGVHARTAFRNWLRGRAPTCTVPPVAGEETVVSDCLLGRQGPAEWLVAQGWVRAEPGGPYVALEAEARRERRGLFGPAPVVPAMPPTIPAMPPTIPAVPEVTTPDLPAPGPSGG